MEQHRETRRPFDQRPDRRAADPEDEVAFPMARHRAVSRSVRDRCLAYLDGVNSEIEIDIRSMWPSHEARLRREGLA